LTAFVVFVRTYAVWIYLLCVVGILLGAKLLVDARRLSRTTLFSLEQERANEQSVRAIILVVASLLMLGAIAFVNLLIAPLAPPSESPVSRAPTATLAPIVFASSTPTALATNTSPAKPIEPTTIATASGASTATRTLTIPRPSVPPTLPISPTIVYTMPAPVIVGPLPNGGVWTGENQANAAITFRWTCDACNLGANDWYEIAISFIDRKGMSRTVAGRTKEKFLALKRIYEGGGFEVYQQAKEDTYTWTVQVKRESGNIPLSPPSIAWKFIWH
jgi:hypothetical protein